MTTLKKWLDQKLAGSLLNQLLILALFILLVILLLSLVAFVIQWIFYPGSPSFNRILWWSTIHFLDPGALGADQLTAKRLAGIAVVIIGGAVFGGILIGVFTNAFDQRLQNIASGRINYNFNNHRIIIGYDPMVPGLVERLLKDNPESEIVIHTAQETETIQNTLSSLLPAHLEKKIFVLRGNSTASEELQRLHIHNADGLYILGEPNEPGRDAINISCTTQIIDLLNKHPYRPKSELPCHVLFEKLPTYMLAKEFDLSHDKIATLNFLPFNFYEEWARRVFCNFESFDHENSYCAYDDEIVTQWNRISILAEHHTDLKKKINQTLTSLGVKPAADALIEYIPTIEKEVTRETDKAAVAKIKRLYHLQTTRVPEYFPIDSYALANARKKRFHLMVGGFDAMGQAIVRTVARIAHFPDEIRTTITIIDQDIEQAKEEFYNQFPGIPHLQNIEFRFISDQFHSPAIQQQIRNEAMDKECLLYTALCYADPDLCMSLALKLPIELFLNKVPVIIRQNMRFGADEIIRKLKPLLQKKYTFFRFFGMQEEPYDIELTQAREQMAEAAHNTYLATAADERLNFYDPLAESHQPYPTLLPLYKWSNRYLADSFPTKLHALGITSINRSVPIPDGYEEVTTLSDAEIKRFSPSEHNRWVAERIFSGWNQGPVKNEVYKIHKNITSWNKLDDGTKIYDEVFMSKLIDHLKTAYQSEDEKLIRFIKPCASHSS